MRVTIALACAAIVWCSALPAQQQTTSRRPARLYHATAYSEGGATASGKQARTWRVAADTRILPMGTRIQVTGAGAYSGTYTVADTGRQIRGREIDIFIPDPARAKAFGSRTVRVRVLRWGPRNSAAGGGG